jgi:hypothetical protein
MRVILLCIRTSLRKKRRLRVFENRVLKGIFGSKRDEVTGEWRNFITMSFMIGTPRPLFCG